MYNYCIAMTPFAPTRATPFGDRIEKPEWVPSHTVEWWAQRPERPFNLSEENR